jgi:hypothetical protein
VAVEVPVLSVKTLQLPILLELAVLVFLAT